MSNDKLAATFHPLPDDPTPQPIPEPQPPPPERTLRKRMVDAIAESDGGIDREWARDAVRAVMPVVRKHIRRSWWHRLVDFADEINHRTLLRRRITNWLCNYNEQLITEDVGANFYEEDEPIEKIREAVANAEWHGVTAAPGVLVTGTVWSWPPSLITSVSPSPITLGQPPDDAA